MYDRMESKIKQCLCEWMEGWHRLKRWNVGEVVSYWIDWKCGIWEEWKKDCVREDGMEVSLCFSQCPRRWKGRYLASKRMDWKWGSVREDGIKRRQCPRGWNLTEAVSERMDWKEGSVREDGTGRRQCLRRWNGKEAVSEKMERKGGSVREDETERR